MSTSRTEASTIGIFTSGAPRPTRTRTPPERVAWRRGERERERERGERERGERERKRERERREREEERERESERERRGGGRGRRERNKERRYMKRRDHRDKFYSLHRWQWQCWVRLQNTQSFGRDYSQVCQPPAGQELGCL